MGLTFVAFGSACESDVTSAAGGAGGASSGSSNLDQDCFDACVAKGESAEVCTDACSDDTTSSSGKTTTDASTGVGGGVDVELEKACFSCWDSTGACAVEHDACDKSLACLELRNCPFTCGSKPGCVDACNEIIPTGVEPLTALAQCMICNDGPCATECADSIMRAYCE